MIKTVWDYSKLAKSYQYRPDYSLEIVKKIIKISKISKEAKICDIGAGLGHLTIPFANFGYSVIAIEPNLEMIKYGKDRTKKFSNVCWQEGTGEKTNQQAEEFDLITFGSSFNVTDRKKSMKEVYRILKKKSWFTVLWNHRYLEDKIQNEIETIIKSYIKNYNYGSRRQDQTNIINQSKLFKNVTFFEKKIVHNQKVDSIISAWESHATLQRQAGGKFKEIIKDISLFLNNLMQEEIKVPYYTRAWMAQKK